MFLMLALSALNASTYVIGKLLLAYTTPIFLIAVRLVCAGTFFYGFYRLRHAKVALTLHDHIVLLQVALFGYCIPFALEFWALQYMTSAKTAFLYSLAPVVTAILSFFIFKEKMTFKKAIGLGISLIAFIPELVSSTPDEGCKAYTISLPELAIFLAVFAFAYNWAIIRKTMQERPIPASLISSYGMLVGGLLSFVLSCAVEILPSNNPAWIGRYIPVTNVGYFAWYTGLLILIGNICYFALYTHLLKRYTATILSFGELTTPLFAALFGWLIMGETVNWYFFLSLGCLMVGIYLYYSEERRQGYI